MADVAASAVTKIYENTSLTVKARIDTSDVESIEEVTFKFLKDGEQFEEKTVPIAQGEESGGQTAVSHVVKAPAVPDDKTSYFLDYHYFYKIKNPDASTESLQNFPANRIQVFPRVAQLKVTDKDGKAFHNFEFMAEQNGGFSEVRKTVAGNTPNAKGETIPAGSCEFNLGLFAGFRVVPSPPYTITEEIVTTGRKREVKGAVGFRAVFLAPQKGTVRQYVNYDIENLGQTGIGHAVTVQIGAHPDDSYYLKDIASPEIHFRVTYGPEAGSSVAQSERNDTDHPTKVLKAGESDTSATIEEKEAKKKYQGKIKLVEGAGKFVVALGKAGGDACKVEISGSDKFLADPSLSPDATLQFENWRRVHYELMVPHLLRDKLNPEKNDFGTEEQRRLDELSRSLYIEFVHDKTHVFNTVAQADYGTLVPKRFLGTGKSAEEVAYVLSGRNWRKLPDQQSWSNQHPGKSLHIALCDQLLKWRQDTSDEKAGTKDFSGTLKAAIGSINVEEKFEGLFMPFSGHDAGAGVAGIHWTAEISKDDAVCKCKPELTIKEDRYEDVIATGLGVTMAPGEGLPAFGARVVFKRLSYPEIEITDKTEVVDKDDGKLTLKEPALGQELGLEFEVPKEKEEPISGGSSDAPITLPPDVVVLRDEDEDEDEDGESVAGGDTEDTSRRSFSDWGPIAKVEDGKDEGVVEQSGTDETPAITQEHLDKLGDFFRKLYKDGKSKLSAKLEANRFSIEIHGGKGDARRSRRIFALQNAVLAAYSRTHNHEQYDFKKDLTAGDIEQIQGFVDALIAERVAVSRLKGKLEVILACPKDAKHGVDDCYMAVKDKLKELFDKTAKEFPCHPGLDPTREYAPREGDLVLAEITEVSKSSLREWHFTLPAVLADGNPGPGAIVGPEKTAEQCPVKFELSLQPHENSPGEADGKLIAWAAAEPDASKYLASLILRAFAGKPDKPALAHGHGDKGKPGDCLLEAETLCDICIAHGRSRNLTVI